jgi:autotransporter-associated beta strand protein
MLGFGDSSNETLSGTFSGSGGRITKYGSGTVTLTGNNTFDGGVVFSAGILSASSLANLGGTTGYFGLHSGTLQYTGTGSETRTGAMWNDLAGKDAYIDITSATANLTLNATSGTRNQSVNKNGAGTLTLNGGGWTGGSAVNVNAGKLVTTAANMLSDAATVTIASGSTVDLGGAETIGALAGAGNISLGSGRLTTGGNNASTTWSGQITTTGGFTKAGGGVMTLTQGQNYTGTTVITNNSTFGGGLTLSNTTGPALYVGTNGTVVIQGSGAFLRTRATNQLGSNVTVRFDAPSGNAYFSLMGNNQTIGNLEMGANPAEAVIQNTEGETGFGNSILTVNQTTDATYSGYFRNGGSGTIGLVKEGSANLTLSGNRMSYTGGTTVNAGTLTLGGNTPGQGAIRGTVTVNSGATLNYSSANSFGWDSGISVNALNINGGTVGGADISNHFWGGGTFTINMSGGELKLGGGQNPTATMNFNVLSSSDQAKVTAVTSSGSLALDGTATFVVGDGSQEVDLLVSSALSTRNTSGQLFKRGAGTMKMTGTNTYTVGTWVQDGVLEINSSSALGSGALAVEGGLLRYLGTGTDTSSRVFYQNGANGTVDVVNASANLTVNNTSGSQGGSGAKLTKVGAGQLTLGNVNLASGAVVSAGTLQLGSSAGNGNAGSNISVASGSTLKYYSANASWIPLGNTISGAGNLIFEGNGSSGVGDFGISQNNSGFSGPTSINSARVWLTHGSGLGAEAVTIGSGASLAVVNVTVNNAISTAGIGWLESSGNLGAIRFSGTTGNVAGAVTMTDSTRVSVWGGTEIGTISGVISGTGKNLSKTGAGKLILSGANTYTGSTTISEGTLTLGAAERLADVSNLSVAGGATFAMRNFNETLGSIAGAGTISMGSGNLKSIAAANTTFSGVMTGTG